MCLKRRLRARARSRIESEVCGVRFCAALSRLTLSLYSVSDTSQFSDLCALRGDRAVRDDARDRHHTAATRAVSFSSLLAGWSAAARAQSCMAQSGEVGAGLTWS